MTPDAMLQASGDSAWMLISASLVLLMTPGLALFYGGMAGKRAVLNMMMMSFGTIGVITVIYVLWGWSMSYGTESIGGVFGNPFQFFGLKNSITNTSGNYIEGAAGYPKVIDVGFQLTFAVISTALISGALAERVKFNSWLIFGGAWATLVYFPLAHMVWGGGLLSDAENGLSAKIFGSKGGEALIAPIDFAGGTVVHISAGTAALVLAFIVGARLGFPRKVARPHNLTLVMLGAALLWFGWFGFNGGSACAADGAAGLAWINTTAATAAAMLGWLLIERLRDGHATSLGAASGIVAGLVAITPAAGDLTPMTSIVLGVIGGVLACMGVGLKFTFGFDDSLDVVGVHLVAGLWGTVGVGLLATDNGLLTGGGSTGVKLFIVQIIIAAVAMAFSAVFTVIIALIIKSTVGWRIDREEEYNGIDLGEHGETAYDIAGSGSHSHPGLAQASATLNRDVDKESGQFHHER